MAVWIQGSWCGKRKGGEQPPTTTFHGHTLTAPAPPPVLAHSVLPLARRPSSGKWKHASTFLQVEPALCHLPLYLESPSEFSQNKCNALTLYAEGHHPTAPNLPPFLHWSLLQHRGSKTRWGKPHPDCKLKTASTRPGWIKGSITASPRLGCSPEETIPWTSHHHSQH